MDEETTAPPPEVKEGTWFLLVVRSTPSRSCLGTAIARRRRLLLAHDSRQGGTHE